MASEPKKRYPLFRSVNDGPGELLGVFTSAKKARANIGDPLSGYPCPEITGRDRTSVSFRTGGDAVKIYFQQIRMDQILTNPT